METFEVKGNNGLLKFEINEVFGYPKEPSSSVGYDCLLNVEIKIPNYHAKGEFYTAIAEMSRFFEQLNTCQMDLKGEAEYLTLEGNFELKIKYNDLGQTEIIGKFQQNTTVFNCLEFEINSDQSFIKYTVDELKVILTKYVWIKDKTKGEIKTSIKTDKLDKWKFWRNSIK